MRSVQAFVHMLVFMVVVGASHVALAQLGTPSVGDECVDGANCGYIQKLWGMGGIIGVALLVAGIIAAGWAASFAMRSFKRGPERERTGSAY